MPSNEWAIAGRVLTTRKGTPVSNARVQTADGQAALTDAQGRFRLAGTEDPGSSPFEATVSAAGHVTRHVWLTWQRGERGDVRIDLIARGAPFSMKLFRELVRNGFEEPGKLEPIRRWTVAPSLYIRTVSVTSEGKRNKLDAEFVSQISNTARQAVRLFTGSGLRIAAIETGSAAPAERHGWINVEMVHGMPNGVCFETTAETNMASIRMAFNCSGCGGERVPTGVIGHQVGHALGFWHVSDPESMMYWPIENPCYQFVLTDAERHHAAIAYSRPPGNTDPDRDPSDAALVASSVVIADR